MQEKCKVPQKEIFKSQKRKFFSPSGIFNGEKLLRNLYLHHTS